MDGNDSWNDGRRDSGFWPGDVAAGVVGGAVATADAAVDTAGAIADGAVPRRFLCLLQWRDNNGWNNG